MCKCLIEFWNVRKRLLWKLSVVQATNERSYQILSLLCTAVDKLWYFLPSQSFLRNTLSTKCHVLHKTKERCWQKKNLWRASLNSLLNDNFRLDFLHLVHRHKSGEMITENALEFHQDWFSIMIYGKEYSSRISHTLAWHL